MRLNDMELGESLTVIIRLAGEINAVAREGEDLKLFHHLNRIHAESREAMWRLNDLKNRSEKLAASNV